MSYSNNQMIMNLIVIMAFIAVLLYILKKTMILRINSNQKINIIQNTMIGTKERLLLIEVERKKILIGATPNKIETLFVFDDSTLPEISESNSKSFINHLKSAMQKDIQPHGTT